LDVYLVDGTYELSRHFFALPIGSELEKHAAQDLSEP
jgi:hypothetical protein